MDLDDIGSRLKARKDQLEGNGRAGGLLSS
jgi:hypothetical protein